jgi:hypothetical protein
MSSRVQFRIQPGFNGGIGLPFRFCLVTRVG